MPRVKPRSSSPTRSIAGSIMLRSGPIAPSLGRPARLRSCRVRTLREFEAPSTVGGIAFLPKGFRPGAGPLQRRHALVSKRQGRGAGIPGMEGFASRRHRQSGWPVSCHDDAGADAAWLAARRPQAHAHVWLCLSSDFNELDGRRRMASHFGRATAHPLAVPWQRRPDGQRAARFWRRLSIASRSSPVHPKDPIVAVGYGDGVVLFTRIEDGAEILVRKPGNAPVSALAWSADGRFLSFGTEDGAAGVLDLA